jgi:hypothetical protein
VLPVAFVRRRTTLAKMAASYDDAVAELYQAAHDGFVPERKRLAAELKAAGDKPGAARLLKLGRPTLSAWAVNQLWWQSRDSFEQLFAAAARLRAGDQAGAADRRDAVTVMKAKAAGILVQAGHALNEATLRRVTTTLSALAAAGGFEPDAPGALSADRDPPGFDAAGLAGFASSTTTPASPTSPQPPRAPAASTVPAAPAAEATRSHSAARVPTTRPSNDVAAPSAVEAAHRERERHETAARLAERERVEKERVEKERVEKERVEKERVEKELAERLRQELEQRRIAEKRAERQRLEASLPGLRSDLERRQREVERLRAELARVEDLAARARLAIDDTEERLSKFASL